MYIDPPYPGNGANYFHNMRDWNAHETLAERLAKTDCKWIVSSYDKPEIRELFTDAFFMKIQSSSGMSDKKNGSSRVLNKEILITNYEPRAYETHSEIIEPNLFTLIST